MSFNFKKFIILKNSSVSGYSSALKIESDNFITKITGEILSNGFFQKDLSLLTKISNKEVQIFPLEKSKIDLTLEGNAENGLTVVLVDGDFNLVLQGGYLEPLTATELINLTKKRRTFQPYDDEVIATENYYEGNEVEKQDIFSVDSGRDSKNQESKTQEETQSRTVFYEKFDSDKQNFAGETAKRLEEILSTHEKDETLSRLIPESEFCKINYDKTRFYSVGKVSKNGELLYFCYAVLGRYQDAPESLKPFCSFLPLNPFNPLGNGYYIIFQNASNGEIITENRR